MSEHFLRKRGYGDLRLSFELFWALWKHPWPLNVRELEQLISSIAPTAEDGTLSLNRMVLDCLDAQRDLGLGTTNTRAFETQEAPKPRVASQGPPNRETLESLLEHHEGVVSRVARELGVHRYQVYRWAKGVGLDIDAFREAMTSSD